MQSELKNIEREIKNVSRAISATWEDTENRATLLAQLGNAHDKRFDILHELGDNRQAIENWTAALTLTPGNHSLRPMLLDSLGTAHGQRFQLQGEMDDIDQAIEYASIAIKLTVEGHQDLPRQLGNLGASLRERFARLGQLGDLEMAMDCDSRALSLTPDNHPHLSSMLANMGNSHNYRFQRLGELGDLDKAIQCGTRAIDLTPDVHPHMSNMLANLGVSHKDRFQRLGELGDLDKAIQYQSRALNLAPDNHPDLSSWLAGLGLSHKNRFKRLGKLGDLEKAIQYESRAVDLTPDGHPQLSNWLANLGTSHGYYFERLGELVDIEKAIQCQSRALNMTPENHPSFSSILTNLELSHENRFKRLGELGDLDKAIQYGTQALDLTPDGHPHLSIILANLGTSHSYRSNRLGEMDDLNKAIEYHSRALGLTEDDNPDLSGMLTNLGNSHSSRSQRLGGLVDYEKAIQYLSRAVALTADDHPDLPHRLSNLGSCYENRFERLGQLGDLGKAIQCHTRAVDSTPDHHPELALTHFRLATSCFYLYQATNDLSRLGQSLHSFRIATQSNASAPRDRFQYARHWATLAFSHSALNPIEAYHATMSLLPQFIWLGATTNQRYEDLLTAENLAVDAAHAAILASNYTLALEWLEHARCVVWTQNIMLRSPLDQLQSSHPTLAHRLLTVATQLYSTSSNSRESLALASGSMTAEQVAQHHHQLAQDYNDLLSEARALPGFEDFLQPTKANRLVRSARHGPVVVINCHRDRCDALMILPGQDTVKHLPLPNITGDKARSLQSKLGMSLGRSRRELGGVERRPWIETQQADDFGNLLAILWDDVVKPVLDFLGYIKNVPTSILPHITWCPTGAMSFLPLHAAGDYEKLGSRVFNYTISSYTPTLSALLECTQSSLSSNSGVLAIGQEATPGHSRLPGTATELASVKARTENTVRYSQLSDDQATTTVVLNAMEQHDWVHLACHAHQNVSKATESGFFLHDGTLDMAAINRRSFKGKGLAFLSACQTATGDEKLPDEAVHLASGMLMAGYTSVIATMWSVVDADAPVVADGVYARLLPDGKLGKGEAGIALHEAVAVLRESVGVEKFERWVPYIHIGS